ncbi:MAG: cobalt ECF transporter T component CbiQ [Desulfobulbaceae bacterium]|nr:cobalt ECF transporter T component CbiQ [Desulfobulbaceae bacterium]HIJ79696.1 cobalt ECF transporter T component CbiQ [Deltaproteobacteria bacterium]
MLKEHFIQGKSLLHRLDPRGKVLVACFFSLVVALTHSPVVAGGGVVFGLLLVLIARLPWRPVGRRLALVNIFNLFLWLILPLTYAGSHHWQWGALVFSYEGAALAALITLKANGIFFCFLALVATSPVVTMAYALQRLGVPAKLVHLLLFTFRYIHVIEQERQRLVSAAVVRGFKPRVDLHTYRTYAYLVGMLLVKSFARSQRVYEAMLCRGFHGRLYCMSEFSLTREDVVAVAIMLLSVIFLGGYEWLKIS